MNEWIEAYLEQLEKCKQKKEELNLKIQRRMADIQRAERAIERLNKKYREIETPSWVEMLIKPIGETLAKEFGMYYEILGPFGLRAQVSIYWKKDRDLCFTKQPTKSITIVPLNLEKGQLGYETGRKIEGVCYPPNSIGALNGFDREVLPLPDSLKEIKQIIERK